MLIRQGISTCVVSGLGMVLNIVLGVICGECMTRKRDYNYLCVCYDL